jgi:predicted GIY-YIG superfamily endonuclease
MKGIIYLLTSHETDKGYIGSTINLVKRLSYHRDEKNNNCRSKILGNFTHTILEEVIDDDITDKDEFLIKLELVERKWQDLYWDNLVNKKRSQVTREELAEYCVEYYAEHKDEIKEYQAEYYVEHKDEIREQHSKYYAEHKDEIAARKAKKNECSCSGKFTHNMKWRHFKSKKHINFINKLSPED